MWKQKWKINISTALFDRRAEGERERRRHGEEDIEGERQDTLIWRGLVLTSLWEALFSLPWKESIWLILQAVASPCSLTSPSFGYMRIRSQKCICCFAKWKIRKSRILLTSRDVPSFSLCWLAQQQQQRISWLITKKDKLYQNLVDRAREQHTWRKWMLTKFALKFADDTCLTNV